MLTESASIFLYPAFPDGEILNGFLTRLCSFSDFHCLNEISRRLLLKRPSFDGMPRNFWEFYREIGHLYGEMDHLIDRHTELNFYCCGIPDYRFQEQRERLVKNTLGQVRMCRTPVIFNVWEGVRFQCPDCEREQRKTYGFTFVHRRTNVTFVDVCAAHGSRLRLCGGDGCIYKSVFRMEFMPTQHQRARSQEFARRINDCLETEPAQSRYHKDAVVKTLGASGWMDDAGRPHLEDFLDTFSLYFAGTFGDDRLNLLVRASDYVRVALWSLIRRGRSVHPIWCILFSWFAEECSYRSRRS